MRALKYYVRNEVLFETSKQKKQGKRKYSMIILWGITKYVKHNRKHWKRCSRMYLFHIFPHGLIVMIFPRPILIHLCLIKICKFIKSIEYPDKPDESYVPWSAIDTELEEVICFDACARISQQMNVDTFMQVQRFFQWIRWHEYCFDGSGIRLECYVLWHMGYP